MGISYFEFKIRLIRLGLSFQKQNILWLNSQPNNSQSGMITITSYLTLSGRHRKSFSTLQSCLTDSRWIILILLIKLIHYKIWKTRMIVHYGIIPSNGHYSQWYFVHRHLNKAWYNNAHSLFGKPYSFDDEEEK